jgi:hypothetical protein
MYTSTENLVFNPPRFSCWRGHSVDLSLNLCAGHAVDPFFFSFSSFRLFFVYFSFETLELVFSFSQQRKLFPHIFFEVGVEDGGLQKDCRAR